MTTYVDRGREYDVILQARRDPRETSTDLTNIRVRSTRTSELIPLASIVRLEETSGTMQLSRFNRLRAIKVQADLADGYTMGQAVEWFTDTVARGFPEATLMWDVESAECTRTGQQLYFSRISRACGPVRELRASADHHGDRAARAARCRIRPQALWPHGQHL